MKAWLFYKLRPGLEPQLYAWTINSEHAKMFELTRPEFYKKFINLTKEEYKNFNKLGELMITCQKLKTKSNIGMKKITCVGTIKEFEYILTDGETYALNVIRLSQETPMLNCIFNKEIVKTLDYLGYNDKTWSQDEIYVNNPFLLDQFFKQPVTLITGFHYNIDMFEVFSRAYIPSIKKED